MQRTHKKLWVTLCVLLGILALGALLFYRVYLYRPHYAALGAKLESWDMSMQSGMIVVSTTYAWPEGVSPEDVERATALENGAG